MPRILRKFFSEIFIHTEKYDFSKKNRKISRKKFALIFSQGGSKESQLNTEQKVGLRQANILKFQRSNLNKQYFLTKF